jgi:hypothetical protein
MRFSERIGKKKPKCDLQIDLMDADLRNGLWNIVWTLAFGAIRCRSYDFVDDDWKPFLTNVWHLFFKWRVDEIPWNFSDKVQDVVKEWFFKAQWYEVYDFLEFLANEKGPIAAQAYKTLCNKVLEKELSGYRFVGNEIAPITNKAEIAEVDQALEMAEEHSLIGVKKHIESALEKLSDKKNPDYRNSIKESISAVESLSVIIAKDSKATLGQALKKIRDTIGLHPALERGFGAIYGYTSDEGGIRHAMIDETTCDFEDAKYMLVSCSAFVNYLIMKASKAGLT